MSNSRRDAIRRTIALSVGGSALARAPLSSAQAYPTKPIRLVVPYAAGGAVDTVSRLVGGRISEHLGQPVLVDNRPGASTNIGMQQVAKAPADGYTLLMASNTLTTNAALFSNLGFDPAGDFIPIAKVGYAPLVIVVPSTSPHDILSKLVAAAKSEPGKIIYGSAGNGSSGHLAAEQLGRAAGVEFLHVPYKGGAQALTDLIGERLNFMAINPIEVLAQVRAGRLRVLAVGSSKRFDLLPDVPTVVESGISNYEATVWWGLVAAARTPADIVAKIASVTEQSLAEPATREKLSEIGVVVDPLPPESFNEFLRAETARWSSVIRAANIKPD